MSTGGSLTIVNDDSEEEFTESKCECSICKEMNGTNISWEHEKPKTHLQRRMVDVIKRIEDREKYKSKTKSKTK